MNLADKLQQATTKWDMPHASAQIGIRNMRVLSDPTPDYTKPQMQAVLNYFLRNLQEKNWPLEIRDQLIAVDWNRAHLEKLAAYASEDEEATQRLGIDPKKGLLIMGPIGCGKTESMLFLKSIIKPGFKHDNMFDIMLSFNTKGDAGLLPYSKGPTFPNSLKPIDCFFDDLGVERTGTHFGTKAEIGIDLIYMRHMLFKRYGSKNHFTTNMNVDELTKNYKDLCRSRLREMCNVIQFSKNAPDLRF